MYALSSISKSSLKPLLESFNTLEDNCDRICWTSLLSKIQSPFTSPISQLDSLFLLTESTLLFKLCSTNTFIDPATIGLPALPITLLFISVRVCIIPLTSTNPCESAVACISANSNTPDVLMSSVFIDIRVCCDSCVIV